MLCWTGIAVLIVLVGVPLRCMRIQEMASGSMEPTIHGRDTSSQGSGDLVLYSVCGCKSPRKGDLMLIEYMDGTQSVTTIRRVSNIPGEPYSLGGTNQGRLSSRQYILLADATNGVDSRMRGPFDESDFRGRILHVFRSE